MCEKDFGFGTFQCRQAIEALRNGVPNRDAVEILGCNRPAIESRFDALLAQAIDTGNPPTGALGMLISGDFGSGKSHLLSYLAHRALDEGFVCSRVAISKETPLYDLGRVFISAMQHGELPRRTGRLIEEMGDKINARTSEYDQFSLWLNTGDNGLHPYFPASMMIYERCNDLELCSEIEAFWAGERIAASRIRQGLRIISQQSSFRNLHAPTMRDLPPHRLRFATELIKGAGYRGWVVLIDEIELVSSYSLLQRARSYAELARWLGKTTDEQYPGLIVVGTVTPGFTTSVLGPFGKNDHETAANRLRERGDLAMAARADAGIQALENEAELLPPPSEAELKETLDTMRLLYQESYGWEPPLLSPTLDRAAYRNTMRYQIRACINEWDLLRLYPDAQPETESRQFEHSYEESPDMEKEVKDDD